MGQRVGVAKDLDAELVAAFEVVRKKLEQVLIKYAAQKKEIAQLKNNLAEAQEDIDRTIVIVDRSPKPWWHHLLKRWV